MTTTERATPKTPLVRGFRAGESFGRLLDRKYPLVVAALIAAFGLVLAWNVAHYPAANSMDSPAHFRYVETIREEHRLPSPEETHEAQTPPLFHLLAAGMESAWETVTGGPGGEAATHKVVQLFNVVLAMGIALLVFLMARELFPRSRIAQVTALGFFVLSPLITRTAVMYHGQTLATLFATAALYLVVRALVRQELTGKAGGLAGVLLGLGVVTRVFVLATVAAVLLGLAAYFAFTRRRDVFRFGGVLLLGVALLSSPWFIHRQISEGSPLAQSLEAWSSFRDARDKPFFSRQPAEFYLGQPFRTVFTMPYRPAHKNRLPQVLYSDWWGDYFLYFDVPGSLRPDRSPERLAGGRLPEPYHEMRVRQSYVGVLPTLLMLAGLIGLTITALRRRSAALLAVASSVAFVALAGMAWFIGYPTEDGDTMKTVYLLTALPSLAIGAGWLVWRLRERTRIGFGLVLAVLLAAALVDLQFLWIGHDLGG